jgi:hypothetical protein
MLMNKCWWANTEEQRLMSIFSSASVHPYLLIRICPSAFSHQYLLICICS